MSLNLYYIERPDEGGYETFSDAVVVADSEDKAKLIHPDGKSTWGEIEDNDYVTGVKVGWISSYGWIRDNEWVAPDSVKVKLIGVALKEIEAGVICASFHAG